MHKNKIRIFTIISVVILCICYTIKDFDLNNDLFYMIKLGKDIFKYGIDLKDHYSFVSGLTYTYPHWLYTIFIYFIYSKFGFFGVYITSIISYIILMLSIYYVNLKTNKNEYLSSFVTIISVVLIGPFILARAQIYSMLLMIYEVYFINKLIETGRKKYIVYLSIVSLLIANIHGSIWLMNLILYLPFIGEYVVFLLLKKNNEKKKEFGFITIEKIKNIKLVLIALLIASLMGLLSPSRICYTYIFKAALGPSLDYIKEHKRLVPIEQPMFLILLAILFFVRKKVKLRDILMIFGLTILSLMSIRHLFFFYTIGIIYITNIINEYLKEKKEYTIEILGNKIFSKNFIIIVMFILVIIAGQIKFKDNFKSNYINEELYPTKAVKYIKKNLDYKNFKIYNEYDIGSYLLFNDINVFVDSRCELYLKEFTKGKVEIFDDNIKLTTNPTSYKEIFEKYDIEYVLINKRNILTTLIEKDNNYEEIYSDENFILYKEKAGE